MTWYSSQCFYLYLLTSTIMDTPHSFDTLKHVKGFKVVHLNICSIVKKINQIRLLLRDVPTDILTISETWLQPHLDSGLLRMDGYKFFRSDRRTGGTSRKRGGGLITYISSKYASQSEPLEDLDISNIHLEAQWTYIHRPNSKVIVVCNIYRPPSGDLNRAISYLDECLKSFNLNKTDIFLMGDFNVNYKNKKSPNYKKTPLFCAI